jgi:dimethylhistidine N-methyltransferase
VRYRRSVPIWADDNLPGLAGSIRSGAVLAAVRNGTVGMQLGESAVAPFMVGDWFFSHNGMITGWPDSTVKLAERLPVAELLRLDAPTDSALLFALITHRMSADGDPAQAVAAVVREVESAAPGSRLNLLLTDGHPLPVDPPDGRLHHGRLRAVRRRRLDRSTRLLVARGHRHHPTHHADGRTIVTQIDVHLTPDYAARSLREDVRAGLTADPKWLPPKWFYDARGSELFEQITRLPEYYPTRAEREILQTRAGEIAAITKAHTLVELGSGSSEKTRLLLDGLRDHGTLTTFVPLDVSESALREAADAINVDYPTLGVHGVVGDFTAHLDKLPGDPPRIVAFLGGTIGNLIPAERETFYTSVRDVLEPGEWLLLGTDLVKDPQTLVAAYDDRAGVTAEFNRNVLRVINRQLGADFDVDAFSHVALWDAENEWIEMHLRRAVGAPTARCGC